MDRKMMRFHGNPDTNPDTEQAHMQFHVSPANKAGGQTPPRKGGVSGLLSAQTCPGLPMSGLGDAPETNKPLALPGPIVPSGVATLPNLGSVTEPVSHRSRQGKTVPDVHLSERIEGRLPSAAAMAGRGEGDVLFDDDFHADNIAGQEKRDNGKMLNRRQRRDAFAAWTAAGKPWPPPAGLTSSSISTILRQRRNVWR